MADDRCSQCAALAAENARLRAEIARLKQEIKLLKRLIRYLKEVMKRVLSLLLGMYVIIEHVLRESGKIVAKKSGTSPIKWQRHKGRHEIAQQLEGSVVAAIRLLEQVLDQ